MPLFQNIEIAKKSENYSLWEGHHANFVEAAVYITDNYEISHSLTCTPLRYLLILTKL